MKKNLRNILALSLGLMTTVAFAQDWNVDSRTRIDMGGDYDKMETEQRATLGATWGGSDWGIHASSDVNYSLDDGSAPSAVVYEAYASTNLMGYASVTAGRQALDYGSGALMSSNQWGARRTTWDGFNFGLDLSMVDLTVGYANVNDGAFTSTDTDTSNGGSNLYLNAGKAEGDWSVNLLYMSSTGQAGGVEGDKSTAMGLDLAYAMMGGDLNLGVSYNTNSDGTTDQDMMSLGATYNVNSDMSISATRSAYGENGFNMAGTDMAAGWAGGNMGYLSADDVDLAIGVTYSMGDFNLGATMHKVTNEGTATGDSDYDRGVTDISLGYTMSDNASLGLRYATDNNGTDTDTKYTWVTLTITP